MIRVSALKSIRIFGLWDQPRRIVEWNDIKKHSWHELRTNFGFLAEELKTLQPDKQEWIKRGQLKLFDLPEMVMYPVNPFEDLHADLAEVWSMEWKLEQWIDMQITYDQMRRQGLTPQIMQMMDLKLSDWAKLKLKPEDVTEDIAKIFDVDVDECRQILKDYGV